MNEKGLNTTALGKESKAKMATFVTRLKERLLCKYKENDKLCGSIKNLYIAGATQDEVANALLGHECIKSAGITKQVIAGILKDTMDPDLRKNIGRQRGNLNLRHDSEAQRNKGKKGGAKKILPKDKAKEMGKLSHSNKSPANISKEIYELREQRGPTTSVEIGEDSKIPLVGNRDHIVELLSQYIKYRYNIEKTPDAIRGMIERESGRIKSGKEIFQEMPLETRNDIMKMYVDRQAKGEKTFKENNKEYTLTSKGMLTYIKDNFGLKRTKQRFFRSLREYKKGIQQANPDNTPKT